MKRISDRKGRKPKKSAATSRTSAIQIVEEAFHLLRSAPGTALWQYFFGTIPFVCLLFYFWADMSRSSYAERDAGLTALIVGIAFFWKCSWQARFCRGLWARINPGAPPRRKGWQRFRYHAAIWMYQACAIPVMILGICCFIPIAWVLSAVQNGHALGLTQDYGKKPLRHLIGHSLKNSHYEWAQNHLVWIIMGVAGLFTWINVMGAAALPPQLAKWFFGIESTFTTSPAALSNSTFVFGTLLVAYLVLSPLLKAIFVLRCFYAESRYTGADLLSRLAELKNQRRSENRNSARNQYVSAKGKGAGKAALLLIGFCLLFIDHGNAQEKARADASSFESAIQDTMASKKYQWKYSRRPIEIEDLDKEESWLNKQLTLFFNAVEEKQKKIGEWFREKLDDLFDKWSRNSKPKKKPSGFSEGAASLLSAIGWTVVWLLGISLVGGLVYAIVKYFTSQSDNEEGEAIDSIPGDIDLESEDIVADQLPEDEWMKLAREQIDKGESRLAIRALFLATLANLGERGLLKIQKHKTNRQYDRELELKARHKDQLRNAFSDNRGLFDRVWYGLHQLGDEAVEVFMKNYETITNESDAV